MLTKEEPYCLQGTHNLMVFQPLFLPPHLLSGHSSLANLMLYSLPLISGIIFFCNLSLIHLHPHRMLLPPAKCPSSVPLQHPMSLSLTYDTVSLCFVYHLFHHYFLNYLVDPWKVKTASYSLQSH